MSETVRLTCYGCGSKPEVPLGDPAGVVVGGWCAICLYQGRVSELAVDLEECLRRSRERLERVARGAGATG